MTSCSVRSKVIGAQEKVWWLWFAGKTVQRVPVFYVQKSSKSTRILLHPL